MRPVTQNFICGSERQEVEDSPAEILAELEKLQATRPPIIQPTGQVPVLDHEMVRRSFMGGLDGSSLDRVFMGASTFATLGDKVHVLECWKSVSPPPP